VHVALVGPIKLARLYIFWSAARACKEEMRQDCLSCVMKADIKRPFKADANLGLICDNNWQHHSNLQLEVRPQRWEEYDQLCNLSFLRSWGEDKRGTYSKSPNSMCTYFLLTYLVLPIADTKRWCESINGAEITGYVSAILDTNLSKGKLPKKAFCSCGARIKLDSTGREHCKVQDTTARRRGGTKGKVPPAIHTHHLVTSN
jgi:hypothetical protein